MRVLNLLIIFLTFKCTHSDDETYYTFNYNITLPTAFDGNLMQTAIYISIFRVEKIISIQIKDIEQLSLGGFTLMDFVNNLLLIKSTDGSRCAVYRQFPNISFSEMEKKLQNVPDDDGRVQDVVCAATAYVDAHSDHPQEVKEFCNPFDDSMLTTFVDCVPYNPDDSKKITVPFCLRSGIQDENGLSCNRGGYDLFNNNNIINFKN